MELTCTTNPTKTPDSEIDTPPLIKPLSFTNGTFKNNHQKPPYAPPSTAVVYKECLKNHAASLGGHAVDGCGEFIASPDFTPSDPISLKCAACGCHRNFHRREPSENSSPPHFPTHLIDFGHHVLPSIRRFSPSPSPSSSPPLPPSLQPQPVTPTENPSRRKRFRTKFTQEQKEKMHVFSEKLGWKLHKCDEVAVDEFCNDVGVGKGVFRVWMHNNKNTFGKKESQVLNNSNRNHSFEEKNGLNRNGTSSSNEDKYHHHNNNDNSTTSCGLHLHISTNGSSSSS